MLKISYPNIGEYGDVVYRFLDRIIDKRNCEIIKPNPNSKETIELGERASPSYVCTPFKYTLGTLIDSINRGANVVIQIGGGCRFGYYAEVQEKILKKDLGYNIIFLNLYEGNSMNIKSLYSKFKVLNKNISLVKLLKEVMYTISLLRAIDNMQIYIRDIITDVESIERLNTIKDEYYRNIINSRNIGEINKNFKEFKSLAEKIIVKREKKLKIGIVGELYSLMDPFASSYLENDLINKGFMVKRYTTASYLLLDKSKEEGHILKKANNYIKYKLGADGTESVVHTLELIENGYDGVIHIKPFGCTPEINAMPILKKISKDYSFPILFYTFDSLDSKVGFETRVEAFIDMLEMRKNNELLYWN